jgi:hypothetical protein
LTGRKTANINAERTSQFQIECYWEKVRSTTAKSGISVTSQHLVLLQIHYYDLYDFLTVRAREKAIEDVYTQPVT